MFNFFKLFQLLLVPRPWGQPRNRRFFVRCRCQFFSAPVPVPVPICTTTTTTATATTTTTAPIHMAINLIPFLLLRHKKLPEL